MSGNFGVMSAPAPGSGLCVGAGIYISSLGGHRVLDIQRVGAECRYRAGLQSLRGFSGVFIVSRVAATGIMLLCLHIMTNYYFVCL